MLGSETIIKFDLESILPGKQSHALDANHFGRAERSFQVGQRFHKRPSRWSSSRISKSDRNPIPPALLYVEKPHRPRHRSTANSKAAPEHVLDWYRNVDGPVTLSLTRSCSHL
jgi:hypothetical protein